MIKKTISLILCLAILLSLSAAAFAEEKKTINYVVLGNSQAWGQGSWNNFPEQFSNWTGTSDQVEAWEKYGTEADAWNPYEIYANQGKKSGYNIKGVGVISENAYPWIIKTEIENQGYDVNFSQLALSGSKAVDFLTLLDDDFITNDSVKLISEDIFAFMDDMNPSERLSYMREKYQSAIKDADLITFDLGACELTNSIFIGLVNGKYVNSSHIAPEYDKILDPEDYEKFKVLRQMLTEEIDSVIAKYDIDESVLIPVSNIIDATTYNLLSYCTSLDDIMEIIYDCNPDVTVVVLQIQNFYSGETFLLGDTEIPVGEIMQIPTDFLNTYASSFSRYCDKYCYARITENQRVELVADQIMNYSGPEDITQYLIDLLNVLDVSPLGGNANFHLKAMLTPEYQKAGGTVGDTYYNDALNASYDAALQLLSYIYNNYHFNISDGFDGDKEKMISLVDCMLGEISESFVNGQGDYSSAIENAKTNFDSLPANDRSMIALMYYNIAFQMSTVHPSADGQKEMAAGVINALKTENKGIKSILSGLDYSVKSFRRSFDSIAACVKEIGKKVVEDPIAFVTSIVPAETIADAVIERSQLPTEVKTVVSKIVKNSKMPVLKLVK